MPRILIHIFPAALLLAACLTSNDAKKKEPPYDRARAKNEAQRQKWLAKNIPHYQYHLSYKADFMSNTYSGTCRVAPDTSYCDLTNVNHGSVTHPPLMETFFTQVGNSIHLVPPGHLLSDSDELFPKATLFLQGDSMAYYFLITDTTQQPPMTAPVGVEVLYDPSYGFPRSIREIPFGPYRSVSGFTVMTAD